MAMKSGTSLSTKRPCLVATTTALAISSGQTLGAMTT